jgi:hypothetical protein
MTQFIYLRDAGNLVIDDADALSIILARANDYLNHRYVIGFKVLSPNTSKRCEYKVVKRYYYRVVVGGRESRHKLTTRFRCGRKAVVGVLMGKGDKKFTVYLCAEHFEKFLMNAVKHVEGMVAAIYSNMMRIVEEDNPLHDVDFDVDLVLQGGRLGEG